MISEFLWFLAPFYIGLSAIPIMIWDVPNRVFRDADMSMLMIWMVAWPLITVDFLVSHYVWRNLDDS